MSWAQKKSGIKRISNLWRYASLWIIIQSMFPDTLGGEKVSSMLIKTGFSK